MGAIVLQRLDGHQRAQLDIVHTAVQCAIYQLFIVYLILLRIFLLVRVLRSGLDLGFHWLQAFVEQISGAEGFRGMRQGEVKFLADFWIPWGISFGAFYFPSEARRLERYHYQYE